MYIDKNGGSRTKLLPRYIRYGRGDDTPAGVPSPSFADAAQWAKPEGVLHGACGKKRGSEGLPGPPPCFGGCASTAESRVAAPEAGRTGAPDKRRSVRFPERFYVLRKSGPLCQEMYGTAAGGPRAAVLCNRSAKREKALFP